MILNPGEYFTVVRQLQDPADTGTYYVRAIIRNARTDEVLTTLDLTDRGSQRFSKSWLVPADPIGLGFYISVETHVYTDAGHTAVSDVYGQEITTLLVDNRFRSLNAGGGADIDYKKVKKLLAEALSEFEWPKLPDLAPILEGLKKAFNFRDVLLSHVKRIDKNTEGIDEGFASLEEATTRIEAKEFPQQKEVDLSPVLTAIENIPQPDPVNLHPVLEGIDGLRSALDAGALTDLTKAAEALQKVLDSEALAKAVDKMPSIAADVSKIEGSIKDFLFIVAKQGETKDPGPQKPDYHAMASTMVGFPPVRPKPKVK